MKRFLTVIVSVIMLTLLCATVFSGAAEEIVDPSQVYEVQRAPYEDENLSLWFEHSFKKVMTSDITPSDMNTYSVYMGKNEIENAQFVLYSEETMTKLRATVTSFTDSEGNTLDAEIYYQMYVTLDNVGTTAYLGATEENTFLRNGEQPDPVVPFSSIKLFQLNGGKSQAFYIRVKTTEDSKPGWYSAQLDIKNSKGQVIKTATVYTYVWDFVIEDKPALQTAFYMGNIPDQYGGYKDYYDYMLENRMNAMDLPGDLNSSNPYLTNDRVGAVRVTFSNGGNTGTYMESYAPQYYQYEDVYTDLSSMKEWDAIKDKFYFYTVDEPMSQEHQDNIDGITHTSGHTVDDVKKTSAALKKYWPNAATVVPYHENHPYPYYTYTELMADMDPALIKDATQEMIDTASCTVWCPDIFALTPISFLEENGYTGYDFVGTVRGISGTISGNINYGERSFLWEKIYGDFSDRILSNNIVRNSQGNNDRMWMYTAGWGNSYTYAHHMVEHTGLQTKMLFWQMYQEDVTGYLYYDVAKWNVEDVDNTVTGNKTGRWKMNINTTAQGYSTYNSGILFYQATQGGFTDGTKYVGSIRVEMIRDGIEEYQMLTMLEELKGNKASDNIVDSVSNHIASYLSLPYFDRSAFDDSMDDYDVMASVRIRLGNELEAAMKEDACEHTYDEGTVTLEPTCLVMGEMTYECTKCGAIEVEHLPTLHAEGDCFDIETITATGCTTSGKYLYTCRICDYSKYVSEASFHSNDEYFKYEPHSVMTAVHKIICSKCNTELRTENHSNLAEYTSTCTDAGVHNKRCIYCDYVQKVKDVDAKGHYLVESYKAPTCTEEGHKGAECYNCDYSEAEILEVIDHNYVDGKCTMCGESDGSVSATPGDVDGDGEVTMLDLFALKLFIKQKDIPTDAEVAAGDIDGDGELTMVDSFELKYRISKGFWRE